MASSSPSIRVLHLLARPADFQTRRSLDALAASTGAGVVPQVAQIGRGGHWRNRPTAYFPLRALARELDVIQCWDEPALALAAAAATKARILYSPQSAPTGAGIDWVRAAARYVRVDVICPSGPIHRAFVERGVPVDRCHLIRPGVDFSRIRRRNTDSRSALGISETDYVVLAAGESTESADHFMSAWAASILHVLDSRCRLLMWGRGTRAAGVARRARNLGQPRLLLVGRETLGETSSFEDLLPAADAAIISPTGPTATLPIAQCMAAGIPIVTTAGPAAAELLEDRHTALMVKDRKPRLIVEKLMQFREDETLRRKIADNARAEAYKVWPMTGFMDRWRKVYQQAGAGAAIQVE